VFKRKRQPIRRRSDRRRDFHPTGSPVAPFGQRAGSAEPMVIDFGGATYTITPTVDLLATFDPTRPVSFLRAVLGPEQWATFTSTSPTASDLAALMVAIGAASSPRA